MPLFRYLCLAFLLTNALQLPAQQLGLYSVYRDNFQLINPAAMNHFYIAASGEDHNFLFNTGLRQQWAGVEGAPLSFNARFEHAPYGTSMKYGLFFQYDEIFASTHLALSGNYAYFIDLAGRGRDIRRLSIGLNAGLVQQRFDFDRIEFAAPDDAPQAFLTDNRVYADFAFGVFFLSAGGNQPRIYGGISSLQTFTLNVNNEQEEALFAVDRIQHLYGLAGGVFPLGKSGYLEPSTWIRYTPGVSYDGFADRFPLSLNANLRYQLVESNFNSRRKLYGFWFGLGGATSKEVTVELGGLQIDGDENSTYKLGLAYTFYLPGRISLGPTLELNGAFSL